MKLYRTSDGRWVGTQAEAKNKNVIEVPVDKPGLLEWLNENAPHAGPANSASDVDDSSHTDLGHCPKCKLRPDQARADAERWLAGLKADEIVGWMETAPTGKIADVMVAMADRFQAR